MNTALIDEFKREMDEIGVGAVNYFNIKIIFHKLEEFSKELFDKIRYKSSAVSAKESL